TRTNIYTISLHDALPICSQHTSKLIKHSFVYFTMALKDCGLIQNDAFFIDEIKVEADANKYSFTWRRTVEKYHAKLREKTSKLRSEEHTSELQSRFDLVC